jgi:RNA polymerase sigma factor (sigma-70 family)
MSVLPNQDEEPFTLIDTRDEIARTLKELSVRQRAALVLTHLVDMTSEEAAEVLHVRASTVRVLAHQAREAIRARRDEEA